MTDDASDGRSEEADARHEERTSHSGSRGDHSEDDQRSTAEGAQDADPLDWSVPDHPEQSVPSSDLAGESDFDDDSSGPEGEGFDRVDSRYDRASDATEGDDGAVPASEDAARSPDAERASDGSTPGPADPSADEVPGAPLGELASSVRERQEGQRDSVDDGLFEEQDVASIDTDVVWDRLEDDETDDTPTATAGREERVVEKRAYCERCPFFSSPPEVACGHDGTSIVELVDVDHFRVADCPKVEETERLERL